MHRAVVIATVCVDDCTVYTGVSCVHAGARAGSSAASTDDGEARQLLGMSLQVCVVFSRQRYVFC